MTYVDGFVIPAPKSKVAAYKKMATWGKKAWMKHGALQYFECRGEDLKPQEMGDQKARAFPEMAGAGSNEEIWFSFIVFESKQHRDEVNAKVMQEMNEQADQFKDFVMPMDMKRMAYGGFKVLVEA